MSQPLLIEWLWRWELCQAIFTFLLLASHLSQDPFNRPAGTGLFSHDSRHFVPGYYQAVPLGQKTCSPPRLRIKLALMGHRPQAAIGSRFQRAGKNSVDSTLWRMRRFSPPCAPVGLNTYSALEPYITKGLVDIT
jgi:hypothetical protein